jgi:uncharacterized protein (TIGR02246 family)
MTHHDDVCAVRNLLARIVYAGDTGDVETYMGLLTDDVVWEMPGAVHRGAEEVRHGILARRRSGVTGPGSGKRHVLTTTEVRVEGDSASALATWLLVGGDAPPALLGYGTYDDRLRRLPEGWRLQQRHIAFGGA